MRIPPTPVPGLQAQRFFPMFCKLSGRSPEAHLFWFLREEVPGSSSCKVFRALDPIFNIFIIILCWRLFSFSRFEFNLPNRVWTPPTCEGASSLHLSANPSVCQTAQTKEYNLVTRLSFVTFLILGRSSTGRLKFKFVLKFEPSEHNRNFNYMIILLSRLFSFDIALIDLRLLREARPSLPQTHPRATSQDSERPSKFWTCRGTFLGTVVTLYLETQLLFGKKLYTHKRRFTMRELYDAATQVNSAV